LCRDLSIQNGPSVHHFEWITALALSACIIAARFVMIGVA
jgi:hypothetical protein